MKVSKLLELALTRSLTIMEGGCLLTALTFMLVTGVIVLYQRCTSTELYRREYSGIVVDKLTTLHESLEGSSYELFLVIEEKDGNRSQVSVSEGVYTGAEKGMRIQRTRSGVRVSPAETKREFRASPP